MIVNLWIFLIEMLVFAAIFTAIIFAYYRGDRKYNPVSIHNYPPISRRNTSKHTSGLM